MVRRDHLIESSEGHRLFLREVAGGDSRYPPVLLIHGARVPGVPSFDLPVPGGSLVGDLAAAGLRVFAGDLRGYGGSDRPPEMSQDPGAHPPLVRVGAAARDILTMVDWIREHASAPSVSLLGWATGGMWCGYAATLVPEKVARLVLYNALYCSPGHPTLGAGSNMEDPEHPGRFNAAAFGSYRLNPASSLLGAWDASIPVEDPDDWRDPAVRDAYVREALASDPEASRHDPPAFRAPTGALEDSFYQATGRQLWDASLIEAPTLVIAGERDFWSQPVDRELLAAHLVHAPERRVHVIPNGTHFMHLDRAECGRDEFLEVVSQFLTGR